MINYLLFQIVKWNNVVLIIGNSYWECVGKLISDILQLPKFTQNCDTAI